MKKFIAVFMAALMLTFTGCMVQISPSASSDKSTSSGKPLTFEVTKEMKEKGNSPENTESLKSLSNLISKYPHLGAENDVSILYSGLQWQNTNGEQYVAFFVINKTNATYKNMSFTLSMKVADDIVLDGKKAMLSEDVFGEIKPYVAKPLYVTLDDEHYGYLKNANNSNVKVSMADFKADSQ